MKKVITVLFAALTASLLTGYCTTGQCPVKTSDNAWENRLKELVPAYGHRNWIVVADSAYPQQSNPGIETIYTGGTQTEVLTAVLEAIKEAPHVFGNVMIDSELAVVTEEAAPGVDAYRTELKELLKGKHVSEMPHDDIIQKLDEGGKLFNVLLLKTDMVIPYTSVFINLECGYWNAEKEAALRAALK